MDAFERVDAQGRVLLVLVGDHLVGLEGRPRDVAHAVHRHAARPHVDVAVHQLHECRRALVRPEHDEFLVVSSLSKVSRVLGRPVLAFSPHFGEFFLGAVGDVHVELSSCSCKEYKNQKSTFINCLLWRCWCDDRDGKNKITTSLWILYTTRLS